ncbi:hypothetical protein EN811_28585, partial [bacterium M00.F.Ca.ET.168.01.1.1]
LVILRSFWGHVSSVIFRDWRVDSVVLAGAVAAAFLISPGSKANLPDPTQAEGSDRSVANVAGSALDP